MDRILEIARGCFEVLEILVMRKRSEWGSEEVRNSVRWRCVCLCVYFQM